MKIIIGVDFGGSFVSICKKGEGVVFKEPSLISVKGGNSNYKITAVGNKAKEIQAQFLEDMLVFSPFSSGIVKSIDYASYYLSYALSKIFKKRIPYKKLFVIMTVPSGISFEEEKKYILICKKIGIKHVNIIKSTVCIYYLKDNFYPNSQLNNSKKSMLSTKIKKGNHLLKLLPEKEKSIYAIPKMIIDIGGTKTDIAVIDNGKLLIGSTLGIGGNAIDNSIAETIKLNHKIEIDENVAELIKNNIGSLYQTNTLTMEIVGLDTENQTPRSCIICSKDIRKCLLPYFYEINKVIKATLTELSPSIISKVCENGAILSGGVANLSGIEKFLHTELGIKSVVKDNAENNVILGLLSII